MDESATAGGELWTERKGQAAGLTDLAGDMRLEVADRPVGVLHVDHGQVAIEASGDASALLAVDSEATLKGVLGGEVHPFVANLQGRLRIEGDRPLALRIVFGLQAGSPWSGLVSRS
jgi:putative sterol carrier protein